jgi:hypothetical protein
VHEPVTDLPRVVAPTQDPPAGRTVTAPVCEPVQRVSDAELFEAHARLAERLRRKPTGAELGAEVGLSKSQANRWMAWVES